MLKRAEQFRLEVEQVFIECRQELPGAGKNGVAPNKHGMNRGDLFGPGGFPEFGGREQLELLGKREGVGRIEYLKIALQVFPASL